MSTDTLAARLRAAYHADMPGEAVPFDELKPCVCDRWQRVADAARVPAEVPTPTRVPFSDETIERMAKAHMGMVSPGSNWEHADKQYYMNAIRAALAAGGLEPCAPPEYDPADVALAPKIRIAQTARMMEFRWLEICRKHGPEDDVDGCPWLKDALCDFANYLIAHAIIDATQDAMDSTPIIADLHKQLEAARREVDEVRRHISVTMSREHQARKEAQEAKRELAALHPGETVEGVIMERDHYRIQLQHESEWTKQYKQDRDDALAELAALRERDAVPVPAGVPSVEELAANIKAIHNRHQPHGVSGDWHDDVASYILAALAPYLRDPVGWELDVDPEEMYTAWCKCALDYGPNRMIAILDLCRSRIRPVMECKECAARREHMLTAPDVQCAECERWKSYGTKMEDNARVLAKRLDAARAALDGE